MFGLAAWAAAYATHTVASVGTMRVAVRAFAQLGEATGLVTEVTVGDVCEATARRVIEAHAQGVLRRGEVVVNRWVGPDGEDGGWFGYLLYRERDEGDGDGDEVR